MNEDKESLINYRISRSMGTINEAEIMINNGSWNAAVNRIYYACYYMVSALLLKKSIETSSHKGIRLMFGLHFVQAGLVSKEDGRFFSDLYDSRQIGDYEDFILFDEETVKKIFASAKDFISHIVYLLKRD